MSTSSSIATAGYFQLSWQNSQNGAAVQLQQSTNNDFSTIYEGTDSARVISGLPDGEYRFRIRHVDRGNTSNWSETLIVSVQHHSLGKAIGFFFIGLMVFIATLFTIYHGNKRLRSPAED